MFYNEAKTKPILIYVLFDLIFTIRMVHVLFAMGVSNSLGFCMLSIIKQASQRRVYLPQFR